MARTQNPNYPVTGLQLAPQQGANAGYPSYWYDLTSRLLSWETHNGKQRELGLAEAGTASFVLRDKDEYLNPVNTSSPFNSGGNSLKIYRPIRFWMMPSVSPGSWAGNLINSTNDQWLTVRGNTGSYADSASFEGGSTGGWNYPVSGATIANSAVRAHDGTKSMLVTWPTQTGGGGTATISLPGLPCRTGDTYTLSLWLWIVSGPAVTINCNGYAATSTSTTGAWQRVTLSFMAVDGLDTDIYVYASGSTTAGQTVFVDSVQFEYANSASAFTTTGPTIEPVFSGFIERYPKSWRYKGFEGLCQIKCVDALGMIPRVQLDSALYCEIRKDHPFLWYRLDAGELAGNAFPQYGSCTDISTVSWSGAGAALPGCGALATDNRFGPGADQPGYFNFSCAWTSPNAPPALPDGSGEIDITNITSNLVGGSATGYTVEFWVYPFYTGWTQRLVSMGIYGSSVYHKDDTFIAIDSTGHLQWRHYNSAGTLLESITSASAITTNAWSHVVVTTTSNGVNITTTLWLNNSIVGTATRAAATVPTRTYFLLGGGLDGTGSFSSACLPGTGFEPLHGYLSNLVVYTGVLSSTRLGVHYDCANTGYGDEYTGKRLKRILDYAGWSSYTNIPDAVGVLQGKVRGFQGANVGDIVKLTSDTDQGLLYASPAGLLQYLPQATIAASTPTITFGEDTAGGELPYQEGPIEELEPSQIYNDVTVSTYALPTANRYLGNPIHVYDASSIQDYGLRTLSMAIQSRSGTNGHTQMIDMATFLLAQKKDPRPMVQGVVFNPSARPTTWKQLLELYIGQCVTWKRRTSAGVTISINGYIQTKSWSGTPQGTICKIDIEPIQV